MHVTPRHVVYGGIAAAAGAFVALDATMGKPHNWPVFHRLFGADWLVARNIGYAICSIIAAFFGFLFANIKNGG